MRRTPILATARLALHEMSAGDLDFVATMLADPEVMRFHPKCYSRTEAAQWLARHIPSYATHGHGLWLAVDARSGQPVGQTGLLLQHVDGVEEAEVSYLVHRPFWRRGYATEAARAMRDHAFAVLDRPRVISLIRPENLPSQGVARKLGMQPEKRTLHAGFEHLVFAVSRIRPPQG